MFLCCLVGTGSLERISISYKDKSKKKLRKKTNMSLELPGESQEIDEPGPATLTKKKSFKKSFSKMAKLVKRSVGDKDKGQSLDEVDNSEGTIPEGNEVEGEGQGEGEEEEEKSSSSSNLSTEVEQKPRSKKKRPPPRPKDISLKKGSQMTLETPTVVLTSTPGSASEGESGGETHPHQRRGKSHYRGEHFTLPKVEEDEPAYQKSTNSPLRLTTRSRFSKVFLEAGDDFFVVNYIHLCMYGLWLCVANNGGKVMAFRFNITPGEQSSAANVSGGTCAFTDDEITF